MKRTFLPVLVFGSLFFIVLLPVFTARAEDDVAKPNLFMKKLRMKATERSNETKSRFVSTSAPSSKSPMTNMYMSSFSRILN